MSQIKSRSNSIGAIHNILDKNYCYDNVRFRSCSNEELTMIFNNSNENNITATATATATAIPIKRRARDTSFPAERSIAKSPNVHSVMKYLHIFDKQRHNSHDN
jgi:hypothetical protein